jgi:plasmid stability protein
VGDILIRKVPERTKELLRKRAKRRGKSLEADLRDTLESLARSEVQSPDDAEPFGKWAVRISRPGADLDKAIQKFRRARVRPVRFD